MKRLAAARGLLQRAVDQGVTPGAQLAVIGPDGGLAETVVGRLTYDPRSSTVTPATVYDLASLTKPLTALAWVLLRADLDAPLATYLPAAKGTAAGQASMTALLSHRAGMVHWAPFYRDVEGVLVGTRAGRDAVVAAVLATPVGPAGTVRYSDLGYILAGEALAAIAAAPLATVIARTVLRPLGLDRTLGFLGAGEPSWVTTAIAPTERCAWRNGVVQGIVHDENAWAMGGVAGHAGIFGTAAAMAMVGRAMLDALGGRSHWMDGDTAVAMVSPRPGGLHRLGWDGRQAQGSSAGQRMGPRTFGHLGFTGTSVWCDPDADVAVALVTNRVHPTRDNQGIRALRPAVHDAVMAGYNT